MLSSVTNTVLKANKASKMVQHERVFDYMYDPVYTVSSERDHNRVNFRSYTLRNRVRRVYDYGSLFSDCPCYTVKLDPAEPLPAVTNCQWRGHAEQRQEVLRQLGGVNARSGRQTTDTQVHQAEYWKYYKRPLISFPQKYRYDMMSLPSHLRDNLTSVQINADAEPSHCTVEVQTDYRESETQTDPYSPEYVLPPGRTPPELLLKLASLTWGQGLPAGLAEVQMIERMRAKLAWEATLPPLSDLSQLDQRRRMMEKMEAEEWAFRDAEIQELHDARLAARKDLLKQRDEAQKDVTTKRLNLIYSAHQDNIENQKKKIQNDYMRELRKLEAKKKNVGANLEWRGLRPDSLDYVSRIRRDVASKMDASSKFKRFYLDTHEGLLELQTGLDASILNTKHKKATKSVQMPPVNKTMETLQTYKALKEEEKKVEKPLRFLVKKEKPEPRPLTPKVTKPPEGDEEKELAVIYLQKLLRGRCIQYEMAKGKKNHQDLIQEQRAIYALQNDEHQLQKAEDECVKKEIRHKMCQEEARRAGAVGAELHQLFDTLSKELIRLQEERRIHAFMLLAERDRRLREAEESGRRQVEERRRREEDEIFKHVVQVHQESVDLYLEDIILAALGEKADQQAREEIHRRAKEVNDIAYAMEESRDSLHSEEIVSELIYSFLIPEVERINVQQKVHRKQLKHLQAARAILYGAAQPSGKVHDAESATCVTPESFPQHQLERLSQEEQENEAASPT
ncbi:cilia- and flagella-associated protein 91 [Gouania willdenowi]|uniref:cilia- and flagella-associated protein 91 n=1 Tax=Gouania willdenowi TaxID=441366 RepID=UPI0010560137|nr:cilia- and flagella-associated protein 91 [Gouania willdenowi]